MKFEIGKMLDLDTVRPLIVVEGMYWWGADQNNSGGYFERDDEVDHDIFFQDRNYDAAYEKFSEVTYSSAMNYCECCGSRWYDLDGSDSVPTRYGKSILGEYGDMWGGGAMLYLYSGLVLRTMDGKMFEVVRYV